MEPCAITYTSVQLAQEGMLRGLIRLSVDFGLMAVVSTWMLRGVVWVAGESAARVRAKHGQRGCISGGSLCGLQLPGYGLGVPGHC